MMDNVIANIEEEVDPSIFKDVNETLCDRLLFWLSIPLMSRGVHLINNPGKYLTILQVTILLFNLTISCYDAFIYIFKQEWTSNEIPRHLFLMARFFVEKSTTVLFIVRRERVIYMIYTLMKPLSIPQKKTFVKITMIISILVLLFPTGCYIIFANFWREKSYTYCPAEKIGEDSCTAFHIIRLIVPVFNQNMVATPCMVYVVIYMILYRNAGYHIECLRGQLPNVTTSQAYEVLCNIIDSFSEFDNTFSCFTILWLIHMFAFAAGLVLSRFTYLYVQLCYIYNAIILVSIILFMCSTKDKFAEEVQKFQRQFIVNITNNDGKEIILIGCIITQLVTVSSFNMTAWSFFPINRYLILNFTGTLMIYTITFNQVFQG